MYSLIKNCSCTLAQWCSTACLVWGYLYNVVLKLIEQSHTCMVLSVASSVGLPSGTTVSSDLSCPVHTVCTAAFACQREEVYFLAQQAQSMQTTKKKPTIRWECYLLCLHFQPMRDISFIGVVKSKMLKSKIANMTMIIISWQATHHNKNASIWRNMNLIS